MFLLLFNASHGGGGGVSEVFLCPGIRPFHGAALREAGKLVDPNEDLPGFLRGKSSDHADKGLFLGGEHHSNVIIRWLAVCKSEVT